MREEWRLPVFDRNPRENPSDRSTELAIRMQLSNPAVWDNQWSMSRAHSLERARCVTELICHLHLLRQTDQIRQDVNVTEDHAHWMMYGAGAFPLPPHAYIIPDRAAPDPAHVLPHQIYLDGRDATTVPRDPRVQLELRNLFGWVDQLPRVWNDADLMAETNGLRAALVIACRAVIRHTPTAPRPNSPGPFRINRELVRNVYDRGWVPAARQSFEAGIALAENPAQPLHPYISGFQDEGRYRRTMASILRDYLKMLDDRSCLFDSRLSMIEHWYNSPSLYPFVQAEQAAVATKAIPELNIQPGDALIFPGRF